MVRVLVLAPVAVSGRDPPSLNHWNCGTGKAVASQEKETIAVSFRTVRSVGLAVIMGLMKRKVLYESLPAVLLTIQVYVPPSSMAVTLVRVRFSDVSFSRVLPLKLHWNVFPGPPPVRHLKVTVSVWLKVALIGIMMTPPTGDTISRMNKQKERRREKRGGTRVGKREERGREL